ncbi:MAG: hemerythrin domain-containing protein [Verrucomicrobiae bacterium]|nr:hemerythrin domain-containing protein [Verrucomicrobiae bacterium]MDW7979356.1 hemerythrin domain-containing protein [Verrucomicrobiales bacterium]
MKVTEALVAEHVVLHNMFDYIERVLPTVRTVAEVRLLAALIEGVLIEHARAEESLLFGPLAHCLEQIGQRDTFELEHHEIDACLSAVARARSIREARRLLNAAIVACRNHFDHEERVVFPLAERVMKGETLAKLGAVWTKQREAAVA